MKNINISSLNKMFLKSSHEFIQTHDNVQMYSNGCMIALNHDTNTFVPEKNIVLKSESDSKPDLISLVKLLCQNMEKYHYSAALDSAKITHFSISKTKKNTDKITRTKAILLANNFNHVVIQELYYKCFSADCEFLICNEKTNYVFVFANSTLIGIICPMYEDNNNYYEF